MSSFKASLVEKKCCDGSVIWQISYHAEYHIAKSRAREAEEDKQRSGWNMEKILKPRI